MGWTTKKRNKKMYEKDRTPFGVRIKFKKENVGEFVSSFYKGCLSVSAVDAAAPIFFSVRLFYTHRNP